MCFERHWKICKSSLLPGASAQARTSLDVDGGCDSMSFPLVFITAINVKVMEENAAAWQGERAAIKYEEFTNHLFAQRLHRELRATYASPCI